MFLVIVNDIFVVNSAECPVQRHDINTLMMKIYRAKFSLVLPFAPLHRKPPHSQALNWACLIGLVFVGGYSTTDTHNASDRPWNRPTKADVSKDGWFDLGGQYWDSPGVTFPERETVAVLMMKFAEMPIPRLALTVFMLAFLLMLVV